MDYFDGLVAEGVDSRMCGGEDHGRCHTSFCADHLYRGVLCVVALERSH